jgi:hypothetical protein
MVRVDGRVDQKKDQIDEDGVTQDNKAGDTYQARTDCTVQL